MFTKNEKEEFIEKYKEDLFFLHEIDNFPDLIF